MSDVAAARQGVYARIVQVIGALARPDGVSEHERVGAAAVVVDCRAARVEPQLQRPLRQDGVVELDADVDHGAVAVKVVGGRRVDAGCGHRRKLDQLRDTPVVRGDDRMRAAAQGGWR